MSLKDILGKPTHLKSFGNVYPIQLKDWERFEKHLDILLLSKKVFTFDENDKTPLLEYLLSLQNENMIFSLIEIFNIVSRTDSFDFKFTDKYYWFENDKSQIVNIYNYEDLRKIILKQNLIIEPKVFKNEITRKWVEKSLRAKQKNALKISLEDMVTTVASLSGKHYHELENYTIYQIESEFYRWMKIKKYESESNIFANDNVDLSKFKIEHFAEEIELYKDPYEDVFKKKEQLNITKAISNKK